MNVLSQWFLGSVIIFSGAGISLFVGEINFVLGIMVLGTSMFAGGILIVRGIPDTLSRENGNK